MYLFYIYCLAAFIAIAAASLIAFSIVEPFIGARLRWIGKVARRVIGLYALVVIGGLFWEELWVQSEQWTNVEALKEWEAIQKGEKYGTRATWLSDQLEARLADKDTLVAVSISGGGSRAAYFAAAILEQLSKVQMPGRSGLGSSVASNIDVISSVSGGSVAAAYFAAHMPVPDEATEENLKVFFKHFKEAMAYDFEAAVARHVFLNPLNTGAYITFQRSTAVALSKVFDQRLFSGQRLKFSDLIQRAEKREAPLLILNATELTETSLFTFTKEANSTRIFAVTQRPDPILGYSFEQLAPKKHYREKQLVPFGAKYGMLERYQVSHAIAASAAYPALFGTIKVGRPGGPTLFLADGGLVDNLGLISLYSHFFREKFISTLAQEKKRIVVLMIDAETDPKPYSGPVGAVYGLFDLSQQNIQRFILPEMFRRAVYQETASTVGRDLGFTSPYLAVFSYAGCSTKEQVDTSFRLSVSEQSQISNAAQECFSQKKENWIQSIFEQHNYIKLYSGPLGAQDLEAWMTLLRLGNFQLSWKRAYGRFASMENVRAGGMRNRDILDRPRTIAESELKFHGNLDSKAFVYDIEAKSDEVLVYATPRSYPETGSVSLVLKLTDAFSRRFVHEGRIWAMHDNVSAGQGC